MKVELILDENQKPIGWKMTGETEEEKYMVNSIRNLEYGGLDETVIVYNGRENGDGRFAGTLKWIQKQHASK